MYAFIVDELMFATAQEIREQARRARPHVAQRPARQARSRSRFARLVPAGRDSGAVETKARGRGCR
jgi:hypothetical protein